MKPVSADTIIEVQVAAQRLEEAGRLLWEVSRMDLETLSESEDLRELSKRLGTKALHMEASADTLLDQAVIASRRNAANGGAN
jgi:sigma54-dependent transcription regulator